jgi:hypothetical protein
MVTHHKTRNIEIVRWLVCKIALQAQSCRGRTRPSRSIEKASSITIPRPTCARGSDPPRNLSWAQEIFSIGNLYIKSFLGPSNNFWGSESRGRGRRCRGR